MQGAVFMPHNPQQGFPPPSSTIVTDMEASPSPNSHQIISTNTTTKDDALAALCNRSDSGIFSATNNTTISEDISNNKTTNSSSSTSDTDNRSDCSSPERKYLCPICDKMMTSQHDFTLHIRSHNNENEIHDTDKGYTCRICSKVLSSSSSLDRHVLVHSGERPFHCKYCGDTFTTNGNMHRHMRTHSAKSENSYESDASTDSGSSKSTEYNNNRIDKAVIMTNNKRKNQEYVDEEPTKKLRESYEDHRDIDQSYKCPVCEREDFDSADVLETHLEDNHPEYPAKCNQCRHVFLNNKLLLAHKEAIHESNNATKHPVVGFKDLTFVDFSSQKFPLIARRECEMNLHKVSTGSLKFQCRKCSRAFPCSNSLEIHEASCEPTENANGLDLSTISQPEIRRMEFFSRLNLVDNSPEKLSPPPHTPIIPSNKLREQLAKAMDNTKDLADIQSILSNINMQQLQAKHQGVISLPSVPKQPHLEQSLEFQKNEEEESQDLFAVEFRKMKLRGEFPCRLCTAVFPNLRALKGHNRAHLNGNNNGTYYCNMCPHSSIDKAALIRHMRTHNGDRPYECSLCNYAFTTKANCERHLRNRHAKTTREEVKKSIIYHPSEDPTNEDLNKLSVTKDEPSRKLNSSCSTDASDLSPEKVHCSTPKLSDMMRTSMSEIKMEILKPTIPNVPDLQALKPTKMFSDIIRQENLRSLKEQKFLQNGTTTSTPMFPHTFNMTLPQNMSSKIQVKNIDVLRDNINSIPYDDESEDDYIEEEEEDQPLDLVLDLSKKKNVSDDEIKPEEDEVPQDLTKKSPPPVDNTHITSQLPANMGQLFAQHLLKSPPKIDPAALYAQLALYRSGFPNLTNWTGFPLNPLLFPSLPPTMVQSTPDIKERMQRFQLCGGSMISDDFKKLHNLQQQSLLSPNAAVGYNGLKVDVSNQEKVRMENHFSTPKKTINMKPLSLNIESNNLNEHVKVQSPIIPQITKPEMMQSPNSVKMVIKNGVLMPKQKQRRYRTERPFTCEHCSARFTLRSNMERHIKQQHPQFWSQRQRGSVGNPGRKSQQSIPLKPNYCDLSIPNYEPPKNHEFNDAKDFLNEKLKYALLAQQLRTNHNLQQSYKHEHNDDDDEEEDEEEDCELIIDENDDNKSDRKTDDNNDQRNIDNVYECEDKKPAAVEMESKSVKTEEGSQDLVPVSRLLDNASQQQFKEYFKREGEEHEVGLVSEEDEEGLVASGSTSEGNVSGTDENRSESETAQPVKKKSAYSLAPNRVSCPYCSRKFPWTSSLRRHILTHTGQKPFKCSHCPLLFTTKSNCDRHLLRKHGNSATTISNESSQNNNNNSNNYLMRNVPERPFKCSSCPSSTFSTYPNLKKHISSKHSSNAQGDDIKAQGYEAGSSEDEKITNCDAKSDWESQLAFNKLPCDTIVANSDLPFKCHLCEGSFSERQDALDHIREKHVSEYELLMSKNALDPHASTPDESAPHQDDDETEIRGKFPDYSNRKVCCAFCMRRFWSAEDLRRHMRTHTGERPFSCDICRRRFTLKHSMLRHLKKHNIEFTNEAGNNSDEEIDVKYSKGNTGALKTNDSDATEGTGSGGDLITDMLGLGDSSIIERIITGSADDAAKMLGVKTNGKE